jgi:hypothetical protein
MALENVFSGFSETGSRVHFLLDAFNVEVFSHVHNLLCWSSTMHLQWKPQLLFLKIFKKKKKLI